MSWATRHHRESDVARKLPPSTRHQHGCAFLAYMGKIDLGADRGIKNLHDMVAGERENLVHSCAVERPREDVRTSELISHV